MSNPAPAPGTAGVPHTQQLPDGRSEARLHYRDDFGNYHKPKHISRTEHQAIRQVRAAAGWISTKNGSHTITPRTRLADIWLAETVLRVHLAKQPSPSPPTNSTVLTARLPVPTPSKSNRASDHWLSVRPPRHGVNEYMITRFLAEEVYQDIVHTIEQMTRAMERTPTATRLCAEEIRDRILFVLNANYEGNVHGEVFNGKGKTDLMLTWESNNAFIGECKIWRGPKKFREAIDQLLGYVTWRDTKAALVLFVKKGSPTTIFAAAHAQITAHASYVSSKPAEGETRRDYLLRTPADPSRWIDLALVIVVVPPLNGTSS